MLGQAPIEQPYDEHYSACEDEVWYTCQECDEVFQPGFIGRGENRCPTCGMMAKTYEGCVCDLVELEPPDRSHEYIESL